MLGDLPAPALTKSNHHVIVGTVNRKYVYHDFTKFCHMIIAGHTGYGKTNLIKNIIDQLDGVIILIDMKGGFDYEEVSATNIVEAKQMLEYVIKNMRKRRREHMYVIVDEGAELLPPKHLDKDGKRDYLICLHYISEIARIGRGFNVHLIYSTQYPTSDVMPREIKQNCETRICFRLPTTVGSLVVLDEEGAENLPSGVAGIAIYKRDIKLTMKTFEYKEGNDLDVDIRKKKKEGTTDITFLG